MQITGSVKDVSFSIAILSSFIISLCLWGAGLFLYLMGKYDDLLRRKGENIIRIGICVFCVCIMILWFLTISY